MSLAHVTISATHKPGYCNMHLREPRIVKGERVLWYLHAMYVTKRFPKQIDGMISGPGGLFLHYKMVAGSEQLDVLDEDGDQKEIDKITRRLLNEIKKRVREERANKLANKQFNPARKSGQYYLRRNKGGMPATHQTCQQAIASRALAKKFVAQLERWDLELLRPR
jgi:hypothetical protein